MEWISVEDRLPEAMPVIIYEPHCRGNEDKGICVTYETTKEELLERKSDGSLWITHWMPLPDPPKE